jgi:hypothetical protein
MPKIRGRFTTSGRGLAAPVLLIGQDDAHRVAGNLALSNAMPCWERALLSGAPADSRRRGGLQATVPLPAGDAGLRGAADEFDETRSFQETRPFERPAPGAPEPRRVGAARPVVHESIDARSVLLWRDAKDGALVSSVAALPSAPPAPVAGARAEAASQAPRHEAPDAGLPAIAGFESTRDGDPVAHQGVPANWRELARQRDEERRQRVTPVDAGAFSSSFADPSDHPTSPPGLAALARSPAILLVGEVRLAGSSLIRELRGLGCQVDHAHDIEAALARLAGQAYGYAFLDDRSLGRQTRAVSAPCADARALGQTLNIVVMARDEGPCAAFWHGGPDATPG